jgi:hypothetical protein
MPVACKVFTGKQSSEHAIYSLRYCKCLIIGTSPKTSINPNQIEQVQVLPQEEPAVIQKTKYRVISPTEYHPRVEFHAPKRNRTHFQIHSTVVNLRNS